MPATEHQNAVWQVGTIREVIVENKHVKSFTIDLPGKLPHLAGQHCDIRLTAADGYQAARSYSIASAPDASLELQITVQMIPEGEVSGYLDTYARVGDKIEVKSPIGYHFVWTPNAAEPVLLIGGGSGVVPLMSMMRNHKLAGSSSTMTLLYSVRGVDDIIYSQELHHPDLASSGRKAIFTLTDYQPDDWSGYRRRIDREMLEEVLSDIPAKRFYICGPTPMVEAVADLLVEMGCDPNAIKTERFGPTGK